MSSTARRTFLSGLGDFSRAADEPAVRASNSMGVFLRRGLTVAAFNLLETFLADRIAELTAHINAGNTQFLDLPEKLQKQSLRNTLDVAVAHLRRAQLETPDLRNYSADIGRSLAAVGGTLQLSPNTWLWGGSNASADDYSRALRLLHVHAPWEEGRLLTTRLGFPAVDPTGVAVDLKADFEFLTQERHRCAHVATHQVTSIWLRALPGAIMRHALAFDALASAGAHLLHVGDPTFLASSEYVRADKIRVRFVRQRARDHAEYYEGRAIAAHVDRDGDRLFTAACGRASSFDIVVRQGLAKETILWAIPGVD